MNAGQYVVLPASLITRCQGPDTIALLLIIAHNTCDDGVCRAAYKTLADEVGRSRSWVSTTMKRLLARNIIDLQPGFPPDPHEIRIHMDVQSTAQRAPSISSPLLPTEEREGSKREAPVKKRTRLAKDWHPNTADRERAQALRPDLDLDKVTQDFIAYWTEDAAPAKALKANWGRTFVRWCERERTGGKQGPSTINNRRSRLSEAAASHARS